MTRQQQIAAAPILSTPQEKLSALSGMVDPMQIEGEEREEGREWLARHPLSAARGIRNGTLISLAITGVCAFLIGFIMVAMG